jgi:hypothetical protein
MIITRIALPRRTFLRGMGATLALPLLEAMVPAFTATAKTAASPVRRLGVVYVPNGMAMEYWTPQAEGAGFELSPILKPLSGFEQQMLVVSGLNGVPGGTGGPGGAGGAHAGASTPFLTGATGKNSESFLEAGVSLDQIIAREFGRHTQVASLELALDGRDNAGSCDAGYSCAYTNTISWRSRNTPLPMENNPRAVFEQLFGDTGSTGQAARLASIHRDRSVLDSLTLKVQHLERGLGPSDRAKLSEYLEGVRDVERRIQNAEEQSTKELPAVDQPAGIPSKYADHAKLMFDLQVLAYQCDLTRVTTFMMGREFSGRTYPEVGVPEAHHPLSHHEQNPEKIAAMSKVNTYHVMLFREFVEKLRSTNDGDGSLLDHSIIIYGAGISDSNEHLKTNLPILLIGGGSGQLKGGRHLKFASEPPLANLMLTVAEKLGVGVERLGFGTGTLNLDGLSGV